MKAEHANMIIAVLGGALGQLLMKAGMQALPFGSFDAMLRSLLFHQNATMLIVAGIFAYLVSMIVWVTTLKTQELSLAYPILSLGYVIVYVCAAFWPGMQETITVQKTIGIALIIFGVWFVQSSDSTADA